MLQFATCHTCNREMSTLGMRRQLRIRSITSHRCPYHASRWSLLNHKSRREFNGFASATADDNDNNKNNDNDDDGENNDGNDNERKRDAGILLMRVI